MENSQMLELVQSAIHVRTTIIDPWKLEVDDRCIRSDREEMALFLNASYIFIGFIGIGLLSSNRLIRGQSQYKDVVLPI